MKTNVIDFAAAKAANKVAAGDLAPSLAELARLANAGEIRNIFIAWTMADGGLHFGHASLNKAMKEWDDDALRLLGLLKIAERGFLEALSFNDECEHMPPSTGA
jgi:hypothetical protein